MIYDIAVASIDKTHADGATGEGRQRRYNAVPDLARDLRDAARLRLPVDFDQFHFGDLRTGGEHLKDETEANRW